MDEYRYKRGAAAWLYDYDSSPPKDAFSDALIGAISPPKYDIFENLTRAGEELAEYWADEMSWREMNDRRTGE